MKEKSIKKLTYQQSKFVEAMAHPNTKNQTQAAIMAGCPNSTARIQASKWLTNPNISEAIAYRKQRALAHCKVTPEEVLGSAAFQMRSSMNDLLDDTGSFSIERARETGAIDLLKKHKETTRTIYDKEGGCEVTKTVEVEILTNESARKDVANYIGLQQFAPVPQSQIEHFVSLTRTTATASNVSIEETLKFAVETGKIPPELVEKVVEILTQTEEQSAGRSDSALDCFFHS